MARRAASGGSGPTEGKSKRRSAYDFARPIRPPQWRKTGTDEHDGQLLLRSSVQRGDERFLHVLQFVHEHRDGSVRIARSFAVSILDSRRSD